jgi:Flp pilus assembly protein TadD
MTGKALFRTFFLSAVLSLTSMASWADAKVPDSVLGRKTGIVAVHVNDRSGRHVVSATGLVIDGRGVVATSCYVIPKWLAKVENTLVVETEGGVSFPIENLLSKNCSNNVALIQVKGNALPVVKLAPEHIPEQGEEIAVITMTPEPAAAEGRIKSVTRKSGFFQMSVPVTLRRDGSPVLNRKGEVIGIATFLPARKQNQPAVIPAGNVAREFSRYKNLIRDLSSSPYPASPLPPAPDTTEADEAALASLTKKQREGKYDTAESAFLAGCSYEGARRYKEAIEAYARAVSMKRDYAEAYAGLGLAYYKIEKYNEAVEAYKNAIKIRPGIQSVHNKLGATYIILGEYPKALDAFKQAIMLDPKNSDAHFNLGVAYVLTGDRDGAANEYAVLKELDTKSAEKLLDLMY